MKPRLTVGAHGPGEGLFPHRREPDRRWKDEGVRKGTLAGLPIPRASQASSQIGSSHQLLGLVS